MVAKELFEEAMKASKQMGYQRDLVALRQANDGALQDALNTGDKCTYYYQWTKGLMKVLKPKQVVELGGAMGVWDIMALQKLPKDSHLYSITLEEGGLEFSFIADEHENFTPIVGDDLDLGNWKGVDLKKTDLWFFDALHTEEHLTKELELYGPFLKKGAVVLVDDIHSFGLDPVWDKFKRVFTSWHDATEDLHYSGFGIGIV